MEYENFENEFNSLLVETFHNILKTEMQLINNITKTELSMREIHLIEVVSKKNITISDIAKNFEITNASVTVMVNKLADAGYITKQKGTQDARNIFLKLTEKGEAINLEHYNFHKKMIEKISKNFTGLEREVLYSSVKALNELFLQQFDHLLE